MGSFEEAIQMQDDGSLSPRSLNADVLDSNELLPSIGSKLHSEGRCKPCAFFHAKGCHSGASCLFCHQCPAHERQRRKRFLRRIRADLVSDLLSGYDGRTREKTLRSCNSARMLSRTASMEGVSLDDALRRVHSARGGISSAELDRAMRRVHSSRGDISANSAAALAVDHGLQRVQSMPHQFNGQMPPMEGAINPAFAGGSPWGTHPGIAPAASVQQVMLVVPPPCTTPYLAQPLPQPIPQSLVMCAGPEPSVAAAGLMPAMDPWQTLSTCPSKAHLHTAAELQHQLQTQFRQPAIAGPPLSSLQESGLFDMQQHHQRYVAMHGSLCG